MSLADSIGLATAKDLGAIFVTSDHSELEAVEQHEPISFLWLPARPKK
jgi:predicted nucleic acid-binding protein